MRFAARVCSSAGQSTRLISVGSLVQIQPDPPFARGSFGIVFTGLITAQGVVAEVAAAGDGARLRVNAPAEWLAGARTGDSIAADGACLTAEEVAADFFVAALSPETLARCAAWHKNAAVNLEHSLAVGDKLGGHFVSGHVEGVARIAAIEETGDGGRRMVFAPPPELMKFIIGKGSVALDGVSLTVNAADDSQFSAQIVPHTLAATTLGRRRAGDEVNIETDLLARYAQKCAAAGGVL